MAAPERLSAFLAHSGIASRRKVDDIIRSGRVTVNNIIVLQPHHKVTPELDIVTVDNRRVTVQTRKHYIALNKPRGYLSDLSDPRHRPTARSLIVLKTRLYPVGRLDYHSEGLMIFTDDGDFANRVMHPRYGVVKEYHVKFMEILREDDIKAMKAGLYIDGELYSVNDVVPRTGETGNTWYVIRVSEGKNRLIRKIAERLGLRIGRLRRVGIGGVRLGNMKPGEWRFLSGAGIDSLKGRKI
jgi:23S rRNA pseudouridine2605 synthase